VRISSESSEVQIGPGLVMEKVHRTVLAEAESGKFQAICLCGWLSQVTFLEEADLLRALHAHEAAVFWKR